MKDPTRREFLWASGLGLLAGAARRRWRTTLRERTPRRRDRRRLGRRDRAKYVRLAIPRSEVVLLEPNKQFVSCPVSNLVLIGCDDRQHHLRYDRLPPHGVRVLHDTATAIEPDAKRSAWARLLPYDRLIGRRGR